MHCAKKRRTSLENDFKCYVKDEIKLETSIDDPLLKEIHVAAEYNNLELLKGLLDGGHDPNVKDSYGSTPLILAANSDYFDAVNLLLEKGADVFVTDSSGKSVLEILLSKSSLLPVGVEEKLMNVLVNCTCDMTSVLTVLRKSNYNLKLVLYLNDAVATEEFLKHKCIITDDESMDAITFAMSRLHLENIRVLLQCGSGVNERRQFFFRKLLFMSMLSPKRRKLDLVKIFFERLDAWDLYDKDALEYFYMMFGVGDAALIELLLQCKVDGIVKEKFGLDLTAHVFENHKVNVIELLQDRKFDVNAKGKDGSSALHFAVRGNSKEKVLFLLDLGANVNVKNKFGSTPLYEAVVEDLKYMVEILLQNNADIQDSFAIFNSTTSSSKSTGQSEFNPFGKCINFDIQQLLIAQLIINKNLGKSIRPTALECMNLNTRCNDFYKRCYRQIEKMKEHVILDSFTLFTAVTGGVKEIAKYVCNDESARLLEFECSNPNIHPYYVSIVKYKLEKVRDLNRQKVHFTMILSNAVGVPMSIKEMTKSDFNMNSICMNVNSL